MVTKIKVTNDRYTYRVTWSPEDELYVGLCAEFPSLSWLEDDQTEAFEGIKKLVAEVVEDLKANGEKVPVPLASRRYSGIFQVRIPPNVHRALRVRAAEAHISLNRLVSAKLAEEVRELG